VYLAARTPVKAADAIAQIKAAVPSANIEFLQLDLGGFKSVKEAVDVFTCSSDRLDILINNAGVMALPPQLTNDGYEIQYGINHMGHALLTKLLLPILTHTASQPGSDVRVVFLSSGGATLAPKGGIAFTDTTTSMANYSTWTRYGQSKAANILYAAEFARRHPNITATSCHPGAVNTELATTFKANHWLIGHIINLLTPVLAKDVEDGVKNQLWCATGKDVINGRFYFPVSKAHEIRGFPKDKKLGKDLWEWTEKELVNRGY
ncbi:retinol dehydrogenase, partial [Glonium stellatum]